MTDSERRAYSRGYHAGSVGKWPAHRPPTPPVEAVAAIMTAAAKLRSAIDGELAKFDKDDPIELALAPRIDDLDRAMELVAEWLKGQS